MPSLSKKQQQQRQKGRGTNFLVHRAGRRRRRSARADPPSIGAWAWDPPLVQGWARGSPPDVIRNKKEQRDRRQERAKRSNPRHMDEIKPKIELKKKQRDRRQEEMKRSNMRCRDENEPMTNRRDRTQERVMRSSKEGFGSCV